MITGTPASLARIAIPNWSFPKHLQILQTELFKCLTDDTYNRMVISIPVRHGKSWFFSVVLPAWWHCMRPRENIILSTGEQILCDKFAAQARGIIQQYGQMFSGVQLDPKYQSRDYWRTTKGGEFFSVSRGSGLAGRGGNLIICDDLIRSIEEANSPTQREKIWDWFSSELVTRLEPGGKIVCVMSRRHPDDLLGRLLDMNDLLPPEQKWHEVNMKAINDEGEALWPERWSAKRLLQIKEELTLKEQLHIWDSLYQQEPTLDSQLLDWPNSYFEDSIWYDELPQDLVPRITVAALDPSRGKEAKSGDYSACVYVIYDDKGHLWVDDSFMYVAPTPQVEDYSVNFISRHPKVDCFAIEVNMDGAQVMADNIISKAITANLRAPIKRWVSTTEKIVRLRIGLSPLLAAKRLHFKRTPHNKIIMNQFKGFPCATKDDGPDAVDIAQRVIAELLTGRVKPMRY